jgi:hypothetical protein
LGFFFIQISFSVLFSDSQEKNMSKKVSDSCRQMEIPSEFLDVENHPTPSDLAKNMSKELVDVYLKTSTPVEKTLFGQDAPLKGPGEMWINPEDRLDGNSVRLTPIKTENIQALTHQGILEIGQRIERQMEEQTQKTVEAAVAESEEFLK